jgi:hypothetical protein
MARHLLHLSFETGWKSKKRPVGGRAFLPQGILYQRFDHAKIRSERRCAGATAIPSAEGRPLLLIFIFFLTLPPPGVLFHRRDPLK